MIRKMFSQPHVLYQTADYDNELSNSALAVSIDSGGTLVITQEDRDIVLNMATVPELCKLLKQLAAGK